MVFYANKHEAWVIRPGLVHDFLSECRSSLSCVVASEGQKSHVHCMLSSHPLARTSSSGSELRELCFLTPMVLRSQENARTSRADIIPLRGASGDCQLKAGSSFALHVSKLFIFMSRSNRRHPPVVLLFQDCVVSIRSFKICVRPPSHLVLASKIVICHLGGEPIWRCFEDESC